MGYLYLSRHQDHHGRVADEFRRVVPCPAGRATCSVDDQVGDATCGQEVLHVNYKALHSTFTARRELN